MSASRARTPGARRRAASRRPRSARGEPLNGDQTCKVRRERTVATTKGPRPRASATRLGLVVILAAVVAHGVDGRDGEVAGDLDLDLGAVGLADDVRFIGRAAVDVGLDALDRAGDLGERG